MLFAILTQHFAAPRITETAYAVSDLCRIGTGMDMRTVDAGLKTFCCDFITAPCTVEDLAGIDVIQLFLGEKPANFLGAQLVKEDSYQL